MSPTSYATISVMLPTRGRPDNLRQSVNALLDFASLPDRLELLIYFDDDDEDRGVAQEVADSFPYYSRVVHSKRLGYKNGHEYYNSLAAMSGSTDLLLLWNDDIDMLTRHWDEMILSCPSYKERVQFLRRDIMETADITLPVIGGGVYSTLGHLSLNCHVDLWLGKVAEEAGIAVMRNDIVFHHYRLEDQTSKDRDGNYDLEAFYGAEMTAARMDDVAKLKAMKAAK